LFVVRQKFSDSLISAKRICFRCGHGLLKKEVDPLSDIILIDGAIFHRMLYQPVDKLGNARDGMLLCQVIIEIKT
jgi:hypothetical protein